jgi:hypothetical protein
MKDLEQEIRKRWFADHVAELKDLGEIQVLNWKRPGTGIYRVRYVFDGNMMYISGDLGAAVFRLTWKASVHSFDISLHYFTEKLEAYCGDRWDFSSEKAVNRLHEWANELKDCEREYSQIDMEELFELARSCSNVPEWAGIVNENNTFIGELDADYWEWFYSIGNEYPARLQSYLIGLQMASEQLRAQEVAG